MRTLLLTGAAALALAACETTGSSSPSAMDEGAGPAAAPAASTQTARDVPQPSISAERLAAYAPKPSRTSTIGYDLLDEALELMVFNAGPSLRQSSGRPDPRVGSRIVRGHTSPYRLEGNKIFFSQFDRAVKESISDYRISLEGIAASTDITTLPKDEQLAFWLNLHNFVVIDEIAQEYPVTNPRRIKPDGGDAPLHTAKIIDVGDEVLSLRDIREIVFAHWADDKNVVYGFYRGDLAGPSIQDRAYNGRDVDDMLKRSASEFVNSLRGVGKAGGELRVSEIYEEARPRLFPNWPVDLRQHLATHADDEVSELLAKYDRVGFSQYQETVADMAGGDVMSDLNNREGAQSVKRPPGMERMVLEYREKLLELRQRGYFKPKVTIIDLPTADELDDE